MARDLNQVTLIGRMAAAPELRHTQTGEMVANFSLATNYQPSGGEQRPAQWHRCVAWGKTGEILAKNCSKGSRIWLSGRLEYRKWTDREGVERYSTDIIVAEFIFLDAVRVSNGQHDQAVEV